MSEKIKFSQRLTQAWVFPARVPVFVHARQKDRLFWGHLCGSVRTLRPTQNRPIDKASRDELHMALYMHCYARGLQGTFEVPCSILGRSRAKLSSVTEDWATYYWGGALSHDLCTYLSCSSVARALRPLHWIRSGRCRPCCHLTWQQWMNTFNIL